MSRWNLLYLSLLLAVSGCSILSPLPSAKESTKPQLHPDSETSESTDEAETIEAVDTTRRGVRRFAVWLGEEVNDWFGDKPFSEGGEVSHGRLSVRLRW